MVNMDSDVMVNTFSKADWNPIFWIEVVGGTLDPKNWIKT